MNRKELKKAYDEGLITSENYGKKLVELESAPKKKKEQRIYMGLTDDEFLKLLKAVHKPIHYLCFILAAESGLRVSEVVNLQLRDIDLENKKILIKEGKGKRDRIAPLPKGFKDYHLKYFLIAYYYYNVD